MRCLALPLSLVLSGCSVLTGFTNTHFDANEYGRYIDIATLAKIGIKQCDMSPPIVAGILLTTTALAQHYSAGKVNNDRIAEAGKELQSLVIELDSRYSAQTPSVAYCQLKLAQISTTAEMIATSIAKKESRK